MILTDKFVILNFPKTGTSYLRKNIVTCYKALKLRGRVRGPAVRLCLRFGIPFLMDIQCRNTRFPHIGLFDQHGAYNQIPGMSRGLPVYSIYRDPYDWYVSNYEFRGWARRSNIFTKSDEFSNLQELSLFSFLEYHRCEMKLSVPFADFPDDIGGLSIHLIHFYGKNPNRIFRRLSKGGISAVNIEEEFPAINFLRNETLSQDLEKLLLRYSRKVRVARSELNERIQPPEGTSRDHSKPLESYLSENMKLRIRELERFAFLLYDYYHN